MHPPSPLFKALRRELALSANAWLLCRLTGARGVEKEAARLSAAAAAMAGRDLAPVLRELRDNAADALAGRCSPEALQQALLTYASTAGQESPWPSETEVAVLADEAREPWWNR